MVKFKGKLIFICLIATVAFSIIYSREFYLLYLKTYYQEIKKESLTVSLEKARTLYKEKRYDALKTYLEDLYMLYPGNREITRLSGLTFIKLGEKLKGARMIIASMTEKEDIRTMGSIVEILFEEKEYKDIIRLLSKQDLSNDSYLAYICAVSLYNEKRYDEAYGYFKAAMKLGKNEYDTYIYMGSILEMKNKAADAITCFEKAYSIDPLKDEAPVALVRLYSNAKQFEKARKIQIKHNR
jgi:tetratricopeptide (TPR) repeat protein